MPARRLWSASHPPTDLAFELNRSSPQANGLINWWPTVGPRATSIARLVDRAGSILLTGGNTTVNTLVPDPVVGQALSGAKITGAVPSGAGPAFAGSGTFAFWTSCAALSANGFLFDTTTSNRYMLWNSGTTLWELRINSTTAVGSISGLLILNTWTHVVFTWTAATTTIYQNGRQFQAPTSVVVGSSTPANFYLAGRADNTTSNYNGKVADFRIYNRALSPAEVWAVYAPDTRWDLYRPARRVSLAGAALIQLVGTFTGRAGVRVSWSAAAQRLSQPAGRAGAAGQGVGVKAAVGSLYGDGYDVARYDESTYAGSQASPIGIRAQSAGVKSGPRSVVGSVGTRSTVFAGAARTTSVEIGRTGARAQTAGVRGSVASIAGRVGAGSLSTGAKVETAALVGQAGARALAVASTQRVAAAMGSSGAGALTSSTSAKTATTAGKAGARSLVDAGGERSGAVQAQVGATGQIFGAAVGPKTVAGHVGVGSQSTGVKTVTAAVFGQSGGRAQDAAVTARTATVAGYAGLQGAAIAAVARIAAVQAGAGAGSQTAGSQGSIRAIAGHVGVASQCAGVRGVSASVVGSVGGRFSGVSAKAVLAAVQGRSGCTTLVDGRAVRLSAIEGWAGVRGVNTKGITIMRIVLVSARSTGMDVPARTVHGVPARSEALEVKA